MRTMSFWFQSAVLAALLVLAGCGGSGDGGGGGTDPTEPELSSIANQSGPPGVTTEVAFSVTAEDPAALSFEATSGDQEVVADENLGISGEGSDRTLSITPNDSPDLAGESVTITLRVEDPNGVDSTSFEFAVADDGSGDGIFTAPPASISKTGSDGFGFAIAISGDYAIVGAPFANERTGAAYILSRSGGSWERAGQLAASDGAVGDQFGYAVVMDENYVIIGAPEADTDAGANAGAAYVFQLIGSTWTETDKVVPFGSGAGPEDKFGWSVAASGDFAVIGAYEDDNNGTNSGSAFVFERDFDRDPNGGLWTERQTLRPADGAPEDRFGISAAMSGDYVIIGASDADKNAATADAGAAYVFRRGDSGNSWTEMDKLEADDGGFGDRFGRAVAISGDYALVGAYLDDNNGDESGSAYVFRLAGDSWEFSEQLTAEDGAAGDLFGRSVAINDSYALVSAYSSDQRFSNAGAVYVFELSGESWARATTLASPSPFEDARFGFSVNLSDSAGIVGAYSDTANLNNAFVYGP